ncbi:MAG: RHS repeat-associated core domain-containing protein [Dehalococcoidales bacterium]|nr:RHS repeat-associated core domain-containing protein [Dehalococcoidales bacterium]
MMTDASGAQIDETMKYLPFGEIIMGNVPTDKKFTGQRLDATGLYYYGARYYDVTIGRFISADTVIQSFINPQSLNRYSYTFNNPLRYIDPSGNIVEIGGLDVRFTRGAAMYIAFLPPDIADSVVDVVESEEYQIYENIRSVDNTVTDVLENTDLVITITSRDLGALVTTVDPDGTIRTEILGAQTERIIEISEDGNRFIGLNIVINNNNLIDQSSQRWTANMAHEMVHAFGLNNNRDFRVQNSVFEENLADIYARSICNKLHIPYTKILSPSYNPSSSDHRITQPGIPLYPTEGGNNLEYGLPYMVLLLTTFGM